MSDPKSPQTNAPTPSTPRRAANRGLGRGLSALMSDVTQIDARPDAPTQEGSDRKELMANSGAPHAKGDTDVRGVRIVAIDQLERNPDQPRRYFDPEKLSELTESIRDKGVLQPILVRPIPLKTESSRKCYQIVAGERRWQASVKAGLESMPVLVRDLSDQDVLEIGVVENVQRADLNPIEEALAYRALVDQFQRTQDDIAKAIGKSRPHIANMLRLLTLPKRAQEFLQEGKITAGHARAIISAPDPTALAENIVEKGLSVRQAEDWVRRLKEAPDTARAPTALKDADTRKVETDLMTALGLSVDLRHKSPGGEIKIKYTNSEQLEGLIQQLLKT